MHRNDIMLIFAAIAILMVASVMYNYGKGTACNDCLNCTACSECTLSLCEETRCIDYPIGGNCTVLDEFCFRHSKEWRNSFEHWECNHLGLSCKLEWLNCTIRDYGCECTLNQKPFEE